MYTPSRIAVSSDPPAVQNTVRVTKAVQFPLSVGATPTPVTVSNISGAIPGGLTYWNKIRIQSVKIWADQTTTTSATPTFPFMPILIVTTTPVGNFEPAVQWNDQGTTGQERPKIGFQLGLATQSQWFGVADIQQLFTVAIHNTNGDPLPGNCRVQVNVEMLSPIL
jgi:hypothetical protein